MKTLGIISVKHDSKRVPGKNFRMIEGKRIYQHNVDLFLDCPFIDKVVLITNSFYPGLNYRSTDRLKLIQVSETNLYSYDPSVFEVWKYAYYSMTEKYDYIITTLACSFGHTLSDVGQVYSLLQRPHTKEVRTIDSYGLMNGITGIHSETLLQKHETSDYLGVCKTSAIDINEEADFEKIIERT